MTSRQLFDFGKSEIKNVNFYYATVEQHDLDANLLENRFAKSGTILGTYKLHTFCPISKDKIEVQDFSASPMKRIEYVSTTELQDSSTIPTYLDCGAIRGYVTAEYDGWWWLACVLRTIIETGMSF